MFTGLLILPASAQNTGGASLLQIYGSNMLFACNKPVKIAGTAAPGTLIEASIWRGGDAIMREGSANVSSDGTFELVMDGIEGGYANYEVKVFANGNLFADLTGVVFGALWLASGQSNMQYGLNATPEGFALSKTGGTEEYIRALQVPTFPEYNGSGDNLPYGVLQDIKGAYWCKGTDTAQILGISAVAYFFACELKKELDMPVGILNASLGGSSIYTWLSRDAIDSAPAVKDYLTATGRYITQDQWSSVTHNPYVDMTANYNKKIEPLRHFEPDGMIWYQGESNISEPHGAYTDAMNLMQKKYSALFGYAGSSMPFVFTQLASYNYGTTTDTLNYVGNFNIQLSEIQAHNPTAVAMTTIYDIPLDWDTTKIDPSLGAVGSIHPNLKKPVGEKMAFAALGLVYGKRASYSAPVVISSAVEGSSITVKFNNVGDGLAVKPFAFTSYTATAAETPLYGFAIAGANGKYVEAKAVITGPDTVKIWSDSVASPVSASYAFSQVNGYSNLFATEGGKFTLGASAFITKRIDGAKYVQDKYWTTCDIDQIWRETTEPYFAPSFRADSLNTSVSYSPAEKFSGTAALKVDYTVLSDKNHHFAFGPALTYNQSSVWPTAFPAINTDYSVNDTVSFKVKNTSGRTVSLDEMRFYTSPVSWFSPLVSGTKLTSAEIPSDGQWHTVTLDLNKLCLYGDAKHFMAGSSALSNVFDIVLRFSDPTAMQGDSSAIYVDDFQFTATDAAQQDYTLYNILTAFRLVFDALANVMNFVGL